MRVRTDRPEAGDTLEMLDEPVRRALEAIGVRRRWRAGQTLMWTGEQSTSAFVVETGRVRIRTMNDSGGEHIVGWIGPGRVCALAPTLSRRRLPWDIVADGTCVAVHWNRERLERLMASNAAVAVGIAHLLSARVHMLIDAQLAKSLPSMADRVGARLTAMALADPAHRPGGPATLRITQADLAKAVGGSRYRVGVALKRLEATRVVALSRGRIELLRRP
jgi:CRP/FNR family transcriptional regulator, cyclic AMP receptor protein